MNPGQTVNTTVQALAAGKRRGQSPSRGFGLDKLFLTLVILYLIVPLGATLAFGLSNGKSIDLHTYKQMLVDSNFSQTLLLSLELSFAATILAIVLVTPTAYWVHLRLPKARPLMDFLSLVPFAIPVIVMSLGLVQEYGTSNPLLNVLSLGLVPLLSNPPFNIVNTPQLLFSAYLIVSLPSVIRPTANSLCSTIMACPTPTHNR